MRLNGLSLVSTASVLPNAPSRRGQGTAAAQESFIPGLMRISGVERDREGMSKERKRLHCNKILSRRGFFYI